MKIIDNVYVLEVSEFLDFVHNTRRNLNMQFCRSFSFVLQAF